MSHKWILKVGLAVAFAVPALTARLGHFPVAPVLAASLFGAAIVASAFLLAWAAEAAQVDISGSLAIAVLAFIAVLPEYAVDLYFAYVAGHRPEFAQYAAANMTGSNRLLIGLGWPLVVLVLWLAGRKQKHVSSGVILEPRRRIELAYLAAAGIYCFLIPVLRRISILDSAVLLVLFAGYIWRVSKEPKGEPDLVGVAEKLAALPKVTRRVMVGSLFLCAALFILASAEPFANALVASGKQLGIDEFLLVQWLAPLASEAPEFVVACILASRLKGDDAIGALLSSKVNQWTLLVGSIPLAHLAGGGGHALPLDARQVEEFVLTATQTVLGFGMLANLRFTVREALLLLGLFVIQFPFPQREVRLLFAAVYLVIGVGLLVWRRHSVVPIAAALGRTGGGSASPNKGSAT